MYRSLFCQPPIIPMSPLTLVVPVNKPDELQSLYLRPIGYNIEVLPLALDRVELEMFLPDQG